MESLSRPFHRRKLSNAASFSGKNAYDGVFSGHLPKYAGAGAPAVKVEDYREIFSGAQSASSIPVLDVSSLDESSDGSNLELGSSKPDYGKIFGGFRDEDIAVSYEELITRDKDRGSSSTSPGSQDLDDLSHQPSDALKQFNMSYHKISQRNKDGLDGTTLVTQLHAVPGFTCFIDETAPPVKKKSEEQKSAEFNDVRSGVDSSKGDFPEKQTPGVKSRSKDCGDESLSDDRINKTFEVDPKSAAFKVSSSSASVANVDTRKDFLEKKAAGSAVKSRGKDHRDDSLSDDMINKTAGVDPKSNAFKVSSSSSSSSSSASVVNVDTRKDFLEKQTSGSAVKSRSKDRGDELLSDDMINITSGVDPKSNAFKVSSSFSSALVGNVDTRNDFLEKQTTGSSVKSRSKDHRDEHISDDMINKTSGADPNLNVFKASSSPSPLVTNVGSRKDWERRSTAVNLGESKRDTTGESSPTYFDEELDVNSAAAASAAALKKAIEKAQESIRVAKESVGRKKEGLKSFSSRSFKDSLKVKARPEKKASEEQNGTDNEVKVAFERVGAASHVFPKVFQDFADSKKLFGAKKVTDDLHGKISESAKKSETLMQSSVEFMDSKEVAGERKAVRLDSAEKNEHETVSSEAVENNTFEAPRADEAFAQIPKGFLVPESLEKKLREAKDAIEEEKLRESKENSAHNLVEESNNLTVYLKVEVEKKISEGSNQNDYEKRLNEAFGLLEKANCSDLEEEDVEIVENTEERDPKLDVDIESQKEEDSGESFYDVSDQESNEVSQSNADSLGKSKAASKDDCEIKEKEPEISESSSSDYDDAEESVSGANNVVTATQAREEVDDVSSSMQVEESEAIDAEFRLEENKIFEKISFDRTPSEDTEDECEIDQNEIDQNDACSESSLDSIHGLEIEVKECNERNKNVVEEPIVNLQKSEEKPEIRSEKETGVSQERKASNEMEENVKKEQYKRIEEVNPEERERERNKLVVERAIREARQRAFAEARERAERAAVERVNAEVRQRVLADAREKVAKASVVTKISDRNSAEAKLRAERAAVERATTEARQRALEKAMSQKNIQTTEARQTSSSGLHSSNGTTSESAQRTKAKLEKHNRIMERAAKALAEKEKRDLLAQKEQAERSRLAENLDADIKRWSSGKEGNLRALLSTLQYILGAGSGWQPVSLTEIITNSAVKKAYRKATLCVHPDKLQQRGASIQQKYICEKVFDLLKAAWNRFNSEER